AVTNKDRLASSFADIHAKDFAIVIENARINAGVQNTSVGKRVSVGGREVKIVHLKLFSVHSNDVSLGVLCRGLFMQHLNLPFDDFILSVPIRSHQIVNMAKHIRKIVQVKPKNRPGGHEHRTEPAFGLIDQSRHASNQGGHAYQQSENFFCENSVTASGDLK